MNNEEFDRSGATSSTYVVGRRHSVTAIHQLADGSVVGGGTPSNNITDGVASSLTTEAKGSSTNAGIKQQSRNEFPQHHHQHNIHQHLPGNSTPHQQQLTQRDGDTDERIEMMTTSNLGNIVGSNHSGGNAQQHQFYHAGEMSTGTSRTLAPPQHLMAASNGATGHTGSGGPGGNTLSSYKINYDPEPQIVRKQVQCPVVYKQEIAVRYLKPPTPPPPGPLLIKEVRASQPPPAPPVIIRQRPPRPLTPPPMLIREQPPQAPQPLGPKVITRNLPAPPPPPRRVIIERLPVLPAKPRSIIVERWLPYKQLKRRVVYQRAPQIEPTPLQKNLIIQWEGAQVKVQKEFRNLGIARADPNMYVQQYGSELKHFSALPDFAKSVGVPTNMTNAAEGNVEQDMSSMLNGTDLMSSYVDNNQFTSYVPQEMISGQPGDADMYNNNSINIIGSNEMENGSSSFRTEYQKYQDVSNFDDLRSNMNPQLDAFTMMNADRSLPSMDTNGNSYGYQYGHESSLPSQSFNLIGSMAGTYGRGYPSIQEFDNMNDRSAGSVASGGMCGN